jgi:translation initiation factor 5A
MAEDGETKDDVKVPDGEVGDKVEKLFKQEEKDLSEYLCISPGVLAEILTFTDVIVLTSMGEEVAIEAKEATRG